MTANKEDKRVVRSKQKLLTTFRELISEKNYEDITVNEICRLADVRRATFYKHFQDKLAFLNFFVGSLRDDFEKRTAGKKKYTSEYDYYVDYVTAVVLFLDYNDKIISRAFESNVLPAIIDVIMQKNYEDTCVRLQQSVDSGMVLRASIKVTAAMMTGAVAQAVLSWYASGKSQAADELISEMSNVLLGMMR